MPDNDSAELFDACSSWSKQCDKLTAERDNALQAAGELRAENESLRIQLNNVNYGLKRIADGKSSATYVREITRYLIAIIRSNNMVLNPEHKHRWQCSGCGFKTNMDIGQCKGRCQDRTGQSCDAVACPQCGRYHYWTGAVNEGKGECDCPEERK